MVLQGLVALGREGGWLHALTRAPAMRQPLLLLWPLLAGALLAQTTAIATLLGQALLLLWLQRQRGALQRAGALLAVTTWLLLALAWLPAALPVELRALGGWILVIALCLHGSCLLLPWLLLRRACRRWGGEAFAALCSWPLAWAFYVSLRDLAWWGGGYGSLALAAQDLPWANWLLPLAGAGGYEVLLWATIALLLAAAPALRVGLAVLLFVTAWLQPPAWTRAQDDVLDLTAVQPAAEGPDWTRARLESAVDQLQAALRQAPRGSLVVTAESYFPEPPPPQPQGMWAEVLAAQSAGGQHLLVGLPVPLRDTEGLLGMNVLLQLSPSESGPWQRSLYAKQRLAPGGESLPWPLLTRPLQRWLLGRELADQSMRAGPPELAQALVVDGHAVAASLCHELAFGPELQARASQAGWLLNLADDSWITDPQYHGQLQALARLRAREAGKPLLRVSRGRASQSFGPGGELLAQAAQAQALNWRLQLQPRQGSTPYGESAALQQQLGLLLPALMLPLGLGRQRAAQAPTSRNR